MESNYYTPEISDIRVGYEYEYLSGHPQEEGNTSWNKWTLDKGDPFIGWRLDGFKRLIEQKMIRTPYLTKEQIEAEGWDENEGSFSKEEYTIPTWGVINWDGRISTFMCIMRKYKPVYIGECPSINEFRYITNKLLKI